MLNRSTTPFAGILEAQAPWWRIGTTGALALLAYLGLLGAALTLGRSPEVRARPAPVENLVVTLLDRPPAVQHLAAASGDSVAQPLPAAPKPKSRSKSPHLATASTTPASTPSLVPEPEPEPDLSSSPSPLPPAALPSPAAPPPKAASSGGMSGTGTGTTRGAPAPVTILPFNDGMTRPKLIDVVEPVYTREARDANVKGLFLAKCVITTHGTLERCRVVKGLPGMDRAVLAALARWRYTPVIYQGKPVAVDYVIQVRLDGP